MRVRTLSLTGRLENRPEADADGRGDHRRARRIVSHEELTISFSFP
jgi:hypothetical protein